jgi:hypothetical protein
MKTLSKEQVLRINCPGFGISSTIKPGQTKPLSQFDVAVINPVSILHLFDEQSDILRQIEVLQVDGMTSYKADDDLIQSISNDLNSVKDELDNFINKGGLLIYFLAPPFSIINGSINLDNYSWLNKWVPDKSHNSDSRNMSATIRGKVIEPTNAGEESPFYEFFKLPNLEWSTIIRVDNLSEGYTPLATAGSNKCTSAWLDTKTNGGGIVFLPFPFEARYEEALEECIQKWWSSRKKGKKKAEETSFAKEDVSNQSSFSNLLNNIAPNMPINKKSSPQSLPNTELTDGLNIDFGQNPEPNTLLSESITASYGNGQSPAEDLMKKMENKVSNMIVPDWCEKYSFEELDQLRSRLSDLNEEVRQAQIRITDLSKQIESMEDIKNALVSADGKYLSEACTRVFELLGWQVTKAGLEAQNIDEFWLLDSDKIEAIVQTVYTQTQARPSELAKLAASVSSYWGTHEIEPKGVLIVSTWADRPPASRNEDDFSESMNEFAQRKGLSLLTTSQLLWIYTDLTTNNADKDAIRRNILSNNGCFNAYPTSLNKTDKIKGAEKKIEEKKVEETPAQASTGYGTTKSWFND